MIKFPSVDQASEEGLLCIGGDLSLEIICSAYEQGIFPWPISRDYPIAWFAPDPRGIIDLIDVHYPKSLLKTVRKNIYTVRFNQNFSEIIHACASVKRNGQRSTWITDEIIQGYINLFRHQKAYCVGTYNKFGKLVGGLYGVSMGEFISGESMFSLESDASKVALYFLLEKLKLHNVSFIDTQMVTPVIQGFGGKEISRKEFMQRISCLDFHRSRQEVFI